MIPKHTPQTIHAAAITKAVIPPTWDARKLKYLISEPITDGPHSTPEFLSEGYPFLSVDGIQDGELVFDDCRYISADDYFEFRKKAAPRKNDILLGKAASTGKIARVKIEAEFSIWSPLALIRPDNNSILSAYLEYCLKSNLLQSQIDDLCSSNTQKNISMGDIPRLVVPVAPLETQRHIADFLDRETAGIDELVKEKERMLALLEEKRIALVSRAVTRGLDAKAPVKPSNLDWLGEIPAHWEVDRAKNLFSVRDQRSKSGEEELLTVSHITGVTRRSEKEVNMFQADDKAGYKLCYPDDLVINTLWGWMGAMGISSLEGIVSPDYHVYTTKGRLLPEFIDLLCRSKPFVAEVSRWSKGVWSSRLRLYPENFFEMNLPVPPHNEQRDIVADIETTQRKARELIGIMEQSIALAKERRAALITSAVTGQISDKEMC